MVEICERGRVGGGVMFGGLVIGVIIEGHDRG